MFIVGMTVVPTLLGAGLFFLINGARAPPGMFHPQAVKLQFQCSMLIYPPASCNPSVFFCQAQGTAPGELVEGKLEARG